MTWHCAGKRLFGLFYGRIGGTPERILDSIETSGTMELWEGKIVVVGGENMDYSVRSPRLPQTGETVQDDLFQEAPDGKGGNQGGDAFDPVVRAFYKAFGVCRIRLLAYPSVLTWCETTSPQNLL